MQRLSISPRANWQAIAAQQGFVYASADNSPYWDESVYYAFSLKQIEDDLEAPTVELYEMIIDLVGRIIARDDWMVDCGIPLQAWAMIRESWSEQDPSLYGRFDFAYDGQSPAKMLEFNGDTPTSLYEAGYFQWHWLNDRLKDGTFPAGTDQFSSIHERLIARFGGTVQGQLALTSIREDEDWATLSYLAHCAENAGHSAKLIDIETIVLDDLGRLTGPNGNGFDTLFKLYPWEWIHNEPLNQAFSNRSIRYLEPAWKLVASSKGILPLLWQHHRGHPNLLESYFESDAAHTSLKAYARKPVFSREGANTFVTDGTRSSQMGGFFGSQPCVRQAYAPLFTDGRIHAVIGSWIIGDESAGIGIRETENLITDNTARFIPHIITA